jgi:hypothetical protein
VSAKANRWREVAADAVAPEAEEAVAPLPARRPAFRLRARHPLQDAGQAVLPLPAHRPALRRRARHPLQDAGQALPLPARRPAFQLRARHLLADAGQALLLPQVGRAEAVGAAAQRCRDCR